MFNINFTYLIHILLPPKFWQSKIIAWLKVCVFYLQKIYEEFFVWRYENLNKLYFTGQVIYLEHLLNEMFNTNGIYIADGEIIDPVYLSNVAEFNFPVYLNNQDEEEDIFWLYNIIEIKQNPDFIVYVPLAFYNSLTIQDIAKINSTVNYYKEFGKNHTIKTY